MHTSVGLGEIHSQVFRAVVRPPVLKITIYLRGFLQQEQHRVRGRAGEQRESVLVNRVPRARRQAQEAVTWREDGVVKEGDGKDTWE